MGCNSGMAGWRCLWDWQKAGVWDRLQHALLDRHGRQNGIDFSRASLDIAPDYGEEVWRDPPASDSDSLVCAACINLSSLRASP